MLYFMHTDKWNFSLAHADNDEEIIIYARSNLKVCIVKNAGAKVVWKRGYEPGTRQVYIFFREEGWYPLYLTSETQVEPNARANPGTLRVEDIYGNLIWGEAAPTCR